MDNPNPGSPYPGKDLPLSFSQESLWFLNRLAPGMPAYNSLHLFRLHGKLDLDVLGSSLNDLVERHDTLRTVFPDVEGVPRQVILSEPDIPLELIDLTSVPASKQEAAAADISRAEFHQPFDLSRGPLLRVKVLQLSSEEYLFLLAAHHIIFDAWSRRIFIKELFQLYSARLANRQPNLPPLAYQYTEYAARQQAWWESSEARDLLDGWKTRLVGKSLVLDLPTDFRRPVVQSYRGAELIRRLPADLLEQLNAFCKKERLTPFMVLLAAFQAVLHQISGQDDIMVGCPFANRTELDTESLIGHLVNTLPVPAQFHPGMTFLELAGQVRDAVLDAISGQACPFEKIVEELNPDRHLSRTPVYQVTFNLRNVPSLLATFNGKPVEDVHFLSDTVAFDLELEARPVGDELSLALLYNQDLFKEETAWNLLNRLVITLEHCLIAPQESLTRLLRPSPDEREKVVNTWNNTAVIYPRGECIHTRFKAVCQAMPDQIALVHADQEVTYQELNLRADRLAHTLQQAGVGPDQLVGICLPRSVAMITSILAVLKAGGAYVPLDPEYPKDRLAYMAVESGMKVILTHRDLVSSLPELVSIHFVYPDEISKSVHVEITKNEVGAENLAYVIYTSGTTGIPKGAALTHRGVVNYIEDCRRTFNLAPGDRVLQFSTINFDSSVREIFGALLSGATLVLRSENMLASVPVFLSECQREHITVLMFATAFWHEIATWLTTNDEKLPGSLRILDIGGEKVQPELVAVGIERMPQGMRFFNSYGPTETTVAATRFQILPPGDTWRACRDIPIGKPLANNRVYILDEEMQPVPPGVTGELFIGGDGVGRGYLNQPELTTRYFLPDPFSTNPNALLYRSGDRAFFQSDGNIRFCGRVDQQIKLRGFRIEPGEVEAVLTGHADILQAVVRTWVREGREAALIAFIVPRPGREPLPASLRSYLKSRLPSYMLPSAFVRMVALPLTVNAKIDTGRLPLPKMEDLAAEHEHREPRNTLEKQLAALWGELLGIEQVGIDDDFFDLGGHSLLALRLMTRLKILTSRDLPMHVLFQAPTIASLSEFLQTSIQQSQDKPFRLRQESKLPALYLIPAGGATQMNLLNLARSIQTEHPVEILEYPGMDGRGKLPESVEGFAEFFLKQVRRNQPHGPYYLGGRCFGGLAAYEMACRLMAAHEPVAIVFIIDSKLRGTTRQSKRKKGFQRLISLSRRPLSKIWKAVLIRIGRFFHSRRKILNKAQYRVVRQVKSVYGSYNPGSYHGEMLLIQSQRRYEQEKRAWLRLVPHLRSYYIPGTRHRELANPLIEGTYAGFIAQAIEDVDSRMAGTERLQDDSVAKAP